MRTSVPLILSALVVPLMAMAANIPPVADQIALAVLAAPEESRAGAGVWGFDEGGHLVSLRKATNDFVCFGDNPAQEKIAVDCVPKNLEDWKVRDWQLRSQGAKKVTATVWSEMESGKLPRPPATWTVHILSGSSFDANTGKIVDYGLRWVVHTPNATAESVGLSSKESAYKPWLMYAATPAAHIMIPGVTEQR